MCDVILMMLTECEGQPAAVSGGAGRPGDSTQGHPRQDGESAPRLRNLRGRYSNNDIFV